VRDGGTLALTDGTLVRLINAKAPAAPIAARNDRPWPFVAEAKQALTELASGAEVELRFGGDKADRHGRTLAQVYVVKGGERLWLQGELVAKGLARVYSFPDNHACVDDLLAREAEARAKGAGLWGVWAYRVLDAGNVERLGRLTRSYQLVEGVVAQVGESGGRLYLNFISTSIRIGARISLSSWSARTAKPSRRQASIPRRLPERSSGCGAGSSGGTAP
ncbi:MAG TPA: thermonuclease family protein, partial [Methyloceanibacter sp.]|nr:thermonuclease family protein [Methyloceanibacter sp.]